MRADVGEAMRAIDTARNAWLRYGHSRGKVRLPRAALEVFYEELEVHSFSAVSSMFGMEIEWVDDLAGGEIVHPDGPIVYQVTAEVQRVVQERIPFALPSSLTRRP